MRTLNLRHVPHLMASDLASFFPPAKTNNCDQRIESLWIGPHFGPASHQTTILSLSQLLHVLPRDLLQLDLDLTLTNNPSDLQSTNCDLAMVLSTLLKCFHKLHTLSLRYRGPEATLAFSRALRNHSTQESLSLLNLDLRGHYMGLVGVQALVDALLLNSHTTQIRRLNLAWNSLTDDCVAALVPLLTARHNALQGLDLSCNPPLTDASLNVHLCQALSHPNCRLEQLVLFSCAQIGTLSPALVHATHTNDTLQQLNLYGTSCSLESPAWDQMQFALELNRRQVGPLLRRQSLLGDWVEKNYSEANHGSHACSNERQDLSILYYVLRETVDQWCGRPDEQLPRKC